MLHGLLRSALALIIATGAVAWPAAQSAKHAITHEDVWLMKRLGTPAVSPDGKWAVLPVTEPAYDTTTQSTDLWMVPTDGSAPPRRLTSTRGAESGVTWSPDGTRLAFSAPVSDGPLSPGSLNALAAQAGRPGGASGQQIFVLDVAGGGAPAQVTDVATGARMPVWRPDGRAILFNSDVYPGASTDAENRQAMADRNARKWSARVYDAFPVRDWDRWLDDRRPSLLVQELSPGAAARDLLATATVGAAGPSPRWHCRGTAFDPGSAGLWASSTFVRNRRFACRGWPRPHRCPRARNGSAEPRLFSVGSGPPSAIPTQSCRHALR